MILKKYGCCFAASIAILAAVFVMYAIFDLFPFGGNTISWCDMDQQTIPLLMDLKDILEGRSGLFYSFGNAGGMNFWGVFLFFLASPLYLTVTLVEKHNIIYLVNILLGIKLALSAFTACLYFRYCHKKLSPFNCAALSIMYAGCGYGLMYCQTLVWLDSMTLLPLLMIALHKLFDQNKPLLYCIMLCVITAVNFYISFMTVVFLLVWSFLYVFMCCPKQKRRKAMGQFAFYSFVAMLITAPVWLCAFLQILSSARSGGIIYNIISRPFFDKTAEKLTVILLTFSCGGILPFFFRSKLMKDPKVKHTFVMLICLLIPVFADPVNKIWHTGSYQCFALRYGFCITLTLLTLTAHFLEGSVPYRKSSISGFAVPTLFSLGFIGISVFITVKKKKILSQYIESLNIDGEEFKIIFALFSFAAVMTAFGVLLYMKNISGSTPLTMLFLGVFIGQFVLGFSANIGFAANDGEVFRNSAPLEYDSDNEAYYRTKTEKKYLHVNMLGGLGYNSYAHYTSLTSRDMMFAMKKLGYSSYWMEIGSNGGTALTDSILGIKYSIGAYFDFLSYYDIENISGDYERACSDIALSAGFVSQLTPDKFGELPETSRVDVQREMAKRYFGDDSLIREYPPVKTFEGNYEKKDDKYLITPTSLEGEYCQVRYTIEVDKPQILYFDVFDRLSNDLYEKYYGCASVYVNGNKVAGNYPKDKNNGILTLGEFSNSRVEVLVLINKSVSVKSFGVFGIDVNKLTSCCEKAKSSCCEMYRRGSTLMGEYTSTSDNEYIYMSVPYDKGMKAYINGNSAEIIKVNDCFCCLKLIKGQNSIQLEFTPRGMGIALVMTGIGVVLFAAALLYRRSKMLTRAADKLAASAVMPVLFYIVSGAVIFAVYIFPTVVWVFQAVLP